LQSTANTEGDSAANVAPPIMPAAAWRMRSVQVVADGRLRVCFVDETTGEVDLRRFLAQPEVTGTVFEALRAPAFFAQAGVVLGALHWPNGAELAPDAIYDTLGAEGHCVLE